MLYDALLPVQKEGVNAACEVEGFAAFFEQRTGKTWVAGGVVERTEPLDTLIVGLKTNLRSTWEKFFKAKLPQYSIFFEWEDYIEHQRAFEKAWGHRDHAILLINYEALPAIIDKAKKHKWDLVIYDEAQKLKARTSRNSKLAKQLVSNAKRRLALTGTPMDKNPIDLWAIMRFVEPEALGTVWKNFESYYLMPIKKPNYKKARGALMKRRMMIGYLKKKKKQKFRPWLLEEFYDCLKPYCMRIEKEDVGIQRPTVEEVYIDLVGDQARIYQTMESDYVVHLRDTTVKASFKATQIGKLQQITGGFLLDEDGEANHVGKAKAKKLAKLLLDIEPPIAIFCKYLPEIDIIERVCREFHDDVAILKGSVKDTKRHKHRTDILKAFQRGRYDVIICQQRTGGAGIDLYLARTAIVYSMGHSFIDYDQMLSRLDFIKQKSVAKFFLLLAKNSIDEDILEAVRSGRSISKITLDRLKRRL